MLGQVEGFVLRSVDYGESSKVITLFSREWGKVAVMARGAKKANRPLHAGTQLGTHGSFLIYKPKGMGTIQQAEILHSFRLIREDLVKTSYAAYVMELVDKFLEEEEPNPKLYDDFFHFFLKLQDGFDPDILQTIFELKILTIAGIRPQVNQCAMCNQTKSQFYFSYREAGFLCQKCRIQDISAFQMTPLVAKTLSSMSRMDISNLKEVEIPLESKKEIKRIMHNYFQEYAGVQLKTKRFLDDIASLQ